jgi:hypothetical protein
MLFFLSIDLMLFWLEPGAKAYDPVPDIFIVLDDGCNGAI